MTFPLSGSFWIKTSVPSNRKSAGNRTAWLRPLRKSLAIRCMNTPVIYTVVYRQGDGQVPGNVVVNVYRVGLFHGWWPAPIHRSPAHSEPFRKHRISIRDTDSPRFSP